MAQLGMAFEDQKIDDDSWNIQTDNDEFLSYKNLTHRKIDFKSPNIDLFFRKQIDKTQYLEANVYGRYSAGDYGRDYVNVYDDVMNNDTTISLTQNKSWRVGFEFMYSKAFKQFTTNFGVQNYFNSARNEQIENGILAKDKINQNRLLAYGQILGRISKLRYSLSANVVFNHSNNNSSYIVNAVRLKTNLNMNYPLSRYVTLNYLLMYDPSMPSISQQSNMVQTIDDISVRQGNPDLKPSEYLRNRLYIRYAYKKFTGSLWAAHSRTFNPIYYEYSYISDVSSPYYDKFMSKPINGKHDDLINMELNLSIQNLFGFATLWGKFGWDNYNINVSNASYDNKLYASINGTFKFGDWLISANYEIVPRYSLSGNVFTSADRWNTISVQYHYKNWYFSATGVNLFTKRGSTYECLTISDVHPERYTQNIRSNANMLLLGVNYRFDFGKQHKKANRILNNGGVERGVDLNY